MIDRKSFEFMIVMVSFLCVSINVQNKSQSHSPSTMMSLFLSINFVWMIHVMHIKLNEHSLKEQLNVDSNLWKMSACVNTKSFVSFKIDASKHFSLFFLSWFLSFFHAISWIFIFITCYTSFHSLILVHTCAGECASHCTNELRHLYVKDMTNKCAMYGMKTWYAI